jgi:hypothetical protein
LSIAVEDRENRRVTVLPAVADIHLAVGPSRPPVPGGLFDLTLAPADDGGLAEPGRPGVSLGADEIVALVRDARGDRGDLRVLVADGAQHAPLFAAVARKLERDVLVTPAGAEPRRLPSAGDGPADFVVPVDRASGQPVDWLLVQPAELATSLPGWFELTGGAVLPRRGVVTLPLPGGLAFASRADFVTRRAASARLGPGHPWLTTVAVTVSSGEFVVGDYRDRLAVLSGAELAAMLPAVPLHGQDLRMWLSWPTSRDDQRRLRANLRQLAESTGATVWAPAVGGRAEILGATRDLAALDADGQPGRWEAYRPEPAGPPRFDTDGDGRLMPVGEWQVSSEPGVPVVSTSTRRRAVTAGRYGGLTACPGLFVADLAVLDDGRLAALSAEGTLIALGPASLRALLTGHGWGDADLVLIGPVPPERADGLRRHLDELRAELDRDVFLAAPGCDVTAQDGRLRAVGPQDRPGSWWRIGGAGPARWHGEDGFLIAAPVVPPVEVPAIATETSGPEVSKPVVELSSADTAATPDPAEETRLATAVAAAAELSDRLVEVQGRYRELVTTRAPADVAALVDSWYAFHRQLALVRYDPTIESVRAGRQVRQEERAAALALTDTLSTLRQRFAEELNRVGSTSGDGVSETDATVLRDRWRLLERGHEPLRFATHLALANLDAAAVDQSRQLTALAGALAEYRNLERTLGSVDWEAIGPAAEAELRDRIAGQLRRAAALRSLAESLIIAAPSADDPPIGSPPDALSFDDLLPPVDLPLVAGADDGPSTPVPDPPGRELVLASRPRPTVPTARVATGGDAAVPGTDLVLRAVPLPEPASRPRLVAAARGSQPHGVPWLPERPQVNGEPFELYVICAGDPQQAASDGLPSPDLFLRGRLDPYRLAGELDQAGHLLRLRVGAGGAVNLPASEVQPPSEAQHLFRETDVYLLPAGWLDRTTIVAGYRATPGGALEPVPCAAGRLMIRPAGARHGAEGLPNEVRRWPVRRWPSTARGYVLLPVAAEAALPDWLAVHRRKPPVDEAYCLVELRIGRGRAIDVAASAIELAPLTSVRSRLVELRSSGVEIILPRRSYDRVPVGRVFEAAGGRWRQRASSLGLPLATVAGAAVGA